MPKIIKVGGDLTKFWQKQVGSIFGTPCILDSIFSTIYVRYFKHRYFKHQKHQISDIVGIKNIR